MPADAISLTSQYITLVIDFQANMYATGTKLEHENGCEVNIYSIYTEY